MRAVPLRLVVRRTGVSLVGALALDLRAECPMLVRGVPSRVERLARCSQRTTLDPTQAQRVTPRMRNSTGHPFARPLVAGSVAAALSLVPVVGVPAAQARAVTCQGQTATVVGPTEGMSTIGTEGDDVIVAPIGTSGSVQGLGGNDTICLVDRVNTPVRDVLVTVLAGPGDDVVYNETTRYVGSMPIELGTGADTFVGTDYPEEVNGGASMEAIGTDTDVDQIDTRGGNDHIVSGLPGVPNHDVISTGAGEDEITYFGLAGGAIDNGTGADWLRVGDQWAGDLTIDNVTQKAMIGAQTMLTWTAIKTFFLRAAPGSQASFVGNDTRETFRVSGTVRDLVAPSTIDTGAGNDYVGLDHYLPASVDTGEGHDTLNYHACDRA